MPFDGNEYENETVKLLTKAKCLIIENGWIKKSFHTIDGYCIVGALQYADNFNCAKTLRSAIRVLFKITHTVDLVDLEDWNDNWFRTKKSVLRAFDRAIELAKNDCILYK